MADNIVLRQITVQPWVESKSYSVRKGKTISKIGYLTDAAVFDTLGPVLSRN